MTKILVLDNYDSFTFNLVHLLQELGCKELSVVRNDRLDLATADEYDRFLLSPGPGLPSRAGCMAELIRRYATTKTILGVCLGHQGIAEVFGARLINLAEPRHGKSALISVVDKGEPLFSGLPESFGGGLYHSWAVSSVELPECLKITAEDSDGTIMGVSHRSYNIKGVQFHPESIMTDVGRQLMENWLKS